MAVSASHLRKTVIGLCVLVFLLGSVVLVGWALDANALKRVFPGPLGMKANAAICLMLCSSVLALLMRQNIPRPVRNVLTLIAFLIVLFAALTLSQDFTGWNFGIDQALFKDADATGRAMPGRMSPPTALCFALIGLALAVISQPLPRRLKLPAASGFGAAVVAVGASALLGYGLNTVQDISAWNFAPMAVDTAVALLLLGAAVLTVVHSEAGLSWALDRWTTGGFAVGMVLLLGMAAGSYYFTRQLQQQAASVSHTQQVIESAERLAGNLSDITTGLRGYLIVGDPQALASRERLKAKVMSDLELLGKLTLDNARQQRRLREIAPLIAERFDVGETLIAARRQQGFDAAQQMLAKTRNVPLADDVRRLNDEIRNEEYALREQRQAQFSAISVRTFLVLPLTGFMSLTLLLLGVFFLNKGAVERNRTNAQLATSRAQFKTIFDHLTEAVVVIDKNRNEIFANPPALSRLGLVDPKLPPEEAVDLLDSISLDGTVLPKAQYPSYRALRGDFVKNYPLVVRRKDNGQAVTAEFNTAPILDVAGEAVQFIISFHDITERVQAEKHTQRLANFYAALSQTNQAVVHVREADALFPDICRICVEYGHAKMAYIGLVTGSHVVPAFFAGPAEQFVSGLSLELTTDGAKELGPIATALHSGLPYVCNDFMRDPRTLPWRERASYLGTLATVVFPFRRAGAVVGVLSLHVAEKDFFSPELIALLDEMVGDLSFALDNMDRETARTEAERQSRLALERFEKIFQGAPEAMSVTEIESGRFVLVNDAYCQTLGYTRQELLGSTAIDLGIWTDMTQRDAMLTALRGGQSVRGLEWNFRRRTGEQRELLCSADTIELEGQTYTLLMFSDITDRKHAEARIEYLANHDGLTGLPNRALMSDRITQAISHARRGNGQLALMYLDLDRFKVINDGYGHPFGDSMLKAAAQRLQAVVRDGDTVARQSGDEFLVLLADLQKFPDAFIVAQKILDAFALPFSLGGREVHMSISIGVSVYPQNGESADELISNADAAMYRAKELGRSTYQFFTREMSDSTRQQVELETQLRNAIAQHELSLVYQPKVALASGQVVGCEALLRWNHPTLGTVSPARFIPIAEESGLIVPIGDWVLRAACLQSKAWLDSGLAPIVMSVNVSARQFLQKDVVQWVFQTLEETGLAPELLELELTESLIAQDTEKVIATVAALKAAKVKVSIDDFGTGYSSLSHLKRFRVDTLKIDQSFIRNMLVDPEDAAIPLAVISMAHSLGLSVIAEGVETAAQCDFLRENGCDEIQGYYFSRPVPPEAFAQMLVNGKRLE